MQLVSIQEKKSTPPQAIVGIDLGTTHSVVAEAAQQQAKVLSIGENHSALLPTMLDAMGQHLVDRPEDGCIEGFKRSMEEPDVPLASGQTPVELSARVLSILKQRTETLLGQRIAGAVLTVPAHFSNVARQATKRAAKQAGLEVLRLLNEPTAAALAYGLQKSDAAGTYLVYDFGGGTFDVTILHMEHGIFQVLASTGDLQLGGRDIDLALLEAVGKTNPSLTERLVAQTVKETGRTHDNALGITRTQFDGVLDHFVQKTLRIVQRVLADLHQTPADIDKVLFVGGSTRSDAVFLGMASLFGKDKILRDIDPDRAVAIGAALHACALADLNHAAARPLLLDIVPASLGLETAMGVVENIIPRYTPTPIRVQMPFSTFYNNQTDILIHILQGDHILASECTSLGQFILQGINPMPGGKPKIMITFEVNEDGILTVDAYEEISGVQKTLTLEPVYA